MSDLQIVLDRQVAMQKALLHLSRQQQLNRPGRLMWSWRPLKPVFTTTEKVVGHGVALWCLWMAIRGAGGDTNGD